MGVPLLVDGHYAWTSPLELTGPGVTVLAVHGRADEAVSAEWSRRYTEKDMVWAEITKWIRETPAGADASSASPSPHQPHPKRSVQPTAAGLAGSPSLG
ncbi:hypothetical protein [Amycolatopsis sp. NPDC051716]|uniref:hypothetical protein n=1 Tax=Amycolatopsis sp. NPDC051716 TaxID=3155804 RepID=UPI00344784E5